jgi:hypothetical protein
MNFQNLTKTQKTVLAWVVNQVETGEMEENFTVLESPDKKYCVYITPDDRPKKIESIPMSIGALEAICKAGFLTCNPRPGRTRGIDCTLMESAYQILKPPAERNLEINEMFLNGVENIPLILRRDIPDCDEVIVKYTEESIFCVTAKAWLASTIMIGAASEKAISLLIDAYSDAIIDKTKQAKFQKKIERLGILNKFEAFEQSYKHNCKNAPYDPIVTEGFNMAIRHTFDFCRASRNRVGHPKIVPEFEISLLIANLNYFPDYIKTIYKLMDYFEENGVEL